MPKTEKNPLIDEDDYKDCVQKPTILGKHTITGCFGGSSRHPDLGPEWVPSVPVPQAAKQETLPSPLPITGFDDIDRFLAETFEVMRKKGHDYRQGNDSDLLHNFRTVANTVGTDMEKVWFTYFYKHYAAMCTFIKEGGQQESEPIEGRITDQIVYLVLFWKMVQERKKVKQGLKDLVNEMRVGHGG